MAAATVKLPLTTMQESGPPDMEERTTLSGFNSKVPASVPIISKVNIGPSLPENAVVGNANNKTLKVLVLTI